MRDPISNTSYFPILKQITEYLGCNLLTRKQLKTNNEYYTLAASSKVSLSLIINYFDFFPLYSSKYLDYIDWKKAAELILTNKHYTDLGVIEIDEIINNMNRKRVYFNWNHLDKL